jgi:phage gp46-like protein
MDFAIEMTAGLPAMTFDKAADIRNNVLLSLLVRRGSWWFNPAFGMRELPKKNTIAAAGLVEEYAREALRWLLDTGRATAIEVRAERDPLQDPHRLKLRLQVTQASGEVLSFEHFVEVV